MSCKSLSLVSDIFRPSHRLPTTLHTPTLLPQKREQQPCLGSGKQPQVRGRHRGLFGNRLESPGLAQCSRGVGAETYEEGMGEEPATAGSS